MKHLDKDLLKTTDNLISAICIFFKFKLIYFVNVHFSIRINNKFVNCLLFILVFFFICFGHVKINKLVMTLQLNFKYTFAMFPIYRITHVLTTLTLVILLLYRLVFTRDVSTQSKQIKQFPVFGLYNINAFTGVNYICFMSFYLFANFYFKLLTNFIFNFHKVSKAVKKYNSLLSMA